MRCRSLPFQAGLMACRSYAMVLIESLCTYVRVPNRIRHYCSITLRAFSASTSVTVSQTKRGRLRRLQAKPLGPLRPRQQKTRWHPGWLYARLISHHRHRRCCCCCATRCWMINIERTSVYTAVTGSSDDDQGEISRLVVLTKGLHFYIAKHRSYKSHRRCTVLLPLPSNVELGT